MFTFSGAISELEFVKQYWQQQPLLIAGALANHKAIITTTDLFELACSDDVESRLILKSSESGDYVVQHGPQDLDQLKQLLLDDNWTLLVQSVNLWSESVASLINEINFVPHWRYDDIMISVSTPGGGVGPHTDNYDVFLLQLDGTRRWRVGTKNHYDNSDSNTSELKLIKPFVATIDHILNPGDVLYVPPGTPHEGISITSGMTLSIGFRSPSHAEFAMMLAEEVSDLDNHYQDSAEDVISSVNEISTEAMLKACNWFKSGIDDLYYCRAFGKLQTQPKQELLLFPISLNVVDYLNSGETLYRDPAARIAWWKHHDSMYLFVNGEEKELSVDKLDMINQLSLAQDIDLNMISAYIDTNNYEEVLMFLTSAGFYGTIE